MPTKRCQLHGLSRKLGSWLPEGLGDTALDVPACFVTQTVCADVLALLRTVGNSGGEEETIALNELRDRGKELSAEEFRKHSRLQNPCRNVVQRDARSVLSRIRCIAAGEVDTCVPWS